MIIAKGTKLLVRNENRGEFTAKARRSFSLDEDAYPLTVIDPMDARCVRGEEILPRAEATTVELMEDELIYAEEAQPETESENEIVNQPGSDLNSGFAGGNIVSFGFSE